MEEENEISPSIPKEIDLIMQELQKVTPKFNKNPKIRDLHALLIKSVDEYTSGTNEMRNLLPTLKENEENAKKHPNLIQPKRGVLNIASMENDFKDAKSDYTSFIKKLNDIQQGKVN